MQYFLPLGLISYAYIRIGLVSQFISVRKLYCLSSVFTRKRKGSIYCSSPNQPTFPIFFKNLWGNRVPGEQDQRRDDRILRNKKKAVKVLMFVVVIFTVCWLPLQTYQVLSVIAPQVNK